MLAPPTPVNRGPAKALPSGKIPNARADGALIVRENILNTLYSIKSLSLAIPHSYLNFSLGTSLRHHAFIGVSPLKGLPLLKRITFDETQEFSP